MLPSSALFMVDAFPLGLLRPSPQILRTDWKGSPTANPLAYWGLVVSDEGKKFYNIDTRLLPSSPTISPGRTRPGIREQRTSPVTGTATTPCYKKKFNLMIESLNRSKTEPIQKAWSKLNRSILIDHFKCNGIRFLLNETL